MLQEQSMLLSFLFSQRLVIKPSYSASFPASTPNQNQSCFPTEQAERKGSRYSNGIPRDVREQSPRQFHSKIITTRFEPYFETDYGLTKSYRIASPTTEGKSANESCLRRTSWLGEKYGSHTNDSSLSSRRMAHITRSRWYGFSHNSIQKFG